jgi:spore maturation protein CgeB
MSAAAIPEWSAEGTAVRVPRQLAILYIGTRSGTTLQRARALAGLGHAVTFIPSNYPRHWRVPSYLDPIYLAYGAVDRIQPSPDFHGTNWRAVRAARGQNFDLVWVDKTLSLHPGTLDRLRALLPRARFVAYSGDDMLNPVHQSPRYLQSIDRYDLHVTTKSYNVAELEQIGAKEVVFVDNAFDPATHRPIELSPRERARFAAEVGFIGAYEQDRADTMYRLAAAGLPVTVRGPDWRRFKKSHPRLAVFDTFLDDDDYPRAVCATKINLGFLRKMNRDLQTTRSVEIPACRGFMLAERTPEHLRMFEEGKEAAFFASFDELLAKCRYYLEHECERRDVAAAGHRRAQARYTTTHLVTAVLDHLFS